MIRSSAVVFKNEFGKDINMSVMYEPESVRVYASGPDSVADHTWTLREARKLCKMLNEVLG